jgi:hypothetical protein
MDYKLFRRNNKMKMKLAKCACIEPMYSELPFLRGITKPFGSYEELFADPIVVAVIIDMRKNAVKA